MNGNIEGGHTSFPRWANAETVDELRVKPEEGKVSRLRNGHWRASLPEAMLSKLDCFLTHTRSVLYLCIIACLKAVLFYNQLPDGKPRTDGRCN